MDVLLAENLFWNFLSRKAPTSAVFCFLKNHDMEKKWKKSSFWMKNFEKNQILKQVFTTRQTLNQEFQNFSDFQSTLNNSSFLESEFLQHVKFWNIFLPHVRPWSEILTTFFTTHQTFKQNKNFRVKVWFEFHIASELESRCLQRISLRWKSVFRKSNFVEKLALKESIIWSIYTIKASKLAFLCILGKVVREKVVFAKKTLFEKKIVSVSFLYNAS